MRGAALKLGQMLSIQGDWRTQYPYCSCQSPIACLLWNAIIIEKYREVFGHVNLLPVVSNRCGTTYQIIIVISILYFHDLLTSVLFSRNDINPQYLYKLFSCKLTKLHYKINTLKVMWTLVVEMPMIKNTHVQDCND